MAGLCEGGNEPPGSLKAICNLPRPGIEPGPLGFAARRTNRYSTVVDSAAPILQLGEFPNPHRLTILRKNDAETDQKEEKELVGSLAEKKLPTEGCTGRNGERVKSSREKKISDDRRH
ncbi:hypothetical protein ANN_22149 [Periplaneta americana]|uniref:Uncharacterized protein n=1 Tax=Periplaneta americana TaxID=6978 RepID=A0ABQ8S879_PERAM|nr:hypothetical protein ANN_22149 [Periplaneta americana]